MLTLLNCPSMAETLTTNFLVLGDLRSRGWRLETSTKGATELMVSV